MNADLKQAQKTKKGSKRNFRSEQAYLARTTFDDDITVFANRSGLLRKCLGGAGVGLRLKVVLFVRHIVWFLRFTIRASTTKFC